MLNMLITSCLLIGFFFVFTTKQSYEKNLYFASRTHTDIIRGLAVFLVIINHVGARSGFRYFQPLGGIGVSLFLLCSGYGLAQSHYREGLSHYFKKRFAPLMVPYWIVFLFYIIINCEALNYIDIIKGLSLIKVPGIFWYIQYIALYYLLFYAVNSINKGKTGIFLLLVLSCFVFILNPTLLLSEQAFAFVGGVWFSKLKINLTEKQSAWIGLFFILIGLISLALKQTHLIRTAHPMVLNLNGVLIKTGTALGLMFLVKALLKYQFLNLFLVASKYSLEIYLVHVVLIKSVLTEYTLANIVSVFTLGFIGVIALKVMSQRLIVLLNQLKFIKPWSTLHQDEGDGSFV